jgi:hypothetical protein
VAAIAAPYTVVGPFSTTTVLFTAPTSTGYYRDVIVTNAGPGTLSVNGATSATATSGCYVPPGQSLILLGPVESLWGTTLSSGTVSCYVGQLTAISVA